MENKTLGINTEDVFKKIIEELVDLGKRQGLLLGKEQINEAVLGMDFTDEQTKLIYEYLASLKIGIDEKLSPEDYLTKEDVDYLQIYLDELEELPYISDGEKQAYIISAMAQDKNAIEMVVACYLKKIVDIARLYAGQGAFLEDLVGEGNVALAIASKMLDCLESYEEADGFIAKMVMDAMEEHIATILDADTNDKKLIEHFEDILNHAKELTLDLGHTISKYDMIREFNYTIDEIEEALSISDVLKEFIKEK